MSRLALKGIQAAAGNAAGEGLYVEEVFSTYLYEGNGSSITITNGIDLAGEGGVVWTKSRTDTNLHYLQSSETTGYLSSNNTDAIAGGNYLSFSSDGYTFPYDFSGWNSSGRDYASWTFRKAPKFFDVVTYTGDGTSNRQIPHNLGSTPGFILIKRTDSTGNWLAWHKEVNPGYGILDLTSAFTAGANGFVNAVADTYFETSWLNTSGATYVAYLFAHNDDDGEFGEDGDQDIIKCGSFTTDGSGAATVDLGFEPQWLLVKSSSVDATNWFILDTMRGFTANGSNDQFLYPNLSNAEGGADRYNPTATGFTCTDQGTSVTYIYIAIRRGPMKTPESGTEVFNDTFQYGEDGKTAGYLGSPADLDIRIDKTGGGSLVRDRLRGSVYLRTQAGDAEAGSQSANWDNMTGYFYYSPGSTTNTNVIHYVFKRAPGFFDMVAYEGSGSAPQNVTHNLTVTPEMMIVKYRDGSTNWYVYHSALGNTKAVYLDGNTAPNTSAVFWNNTSPTATQFTLGSFPSGSGSYIAYLFATVAGVSKVGSYTGNGTSQTIDCGFSAGARFVLIRRVNTTGNWNVWDSERGIVAGNDPRLELNTTDAEDTGHDYIDPDSSGFIVNYVADDDDDSNVNGDTYIFLAIA